MDGTSDEPPARPPAEGDAAPFVWSDAVAKAFPAAFVAFLQANAIHPDNYAIEDVPRYVRVKIMKNDPSDELARGPGTSIEPLGHAELERQLGTSIEPVDWLPGYHRLPSHVKIAGCDAYRSGQLYGIDVSSGAAVAALDAQPGDDVLDLCCAPGAKLCAIADGMDGRGTLTGVDVSEERLAACRTLCLKYGLAHARLVLCDGQQFDEMPPRRKEAPEAEEEGCVAESREESGGEESGGEGGGGEEGVGDGGVGEAGGGGAAKAPRTRKRRRHERQGAFLLGSALGESSDAAGGRRGYDRVIVDAECTHDGSIKHLAKFAHWGWETFERRFLEPSRLASLAELQLALLRNGFRLLRPGGTLVYSTCSFARAQNEDVVAALLAAEPTAALVPVESLAGAPCRPGALPHTLRFEPRLSQSSGLFVARVHKKV